ncbi:MAG TPA: winged helix-turn-helix domain-containing protein [Anaerolineales bacterium]|nr:winged helix-turn-helix domain-containing protein [Anaerolineales bacterium]
MSIPHDDDIQLELLKLFNKAFSGTMHCNDIYDELAKLFPELTEDELNEPYENSASKWANRVQFARLHCVQADYIYVARDEHAQGWGYWTITEEGRKHVRAIFGQ